MRSSLRSADLGESNCATGKTCGVTKGREQGYVAWLASGGRGGSERVPAFDSVLNYTEGCGMLHHTHHTHTPQNTHLDLDGQQQGQDGRRQSAKQRHAVERLGSDGLCAALTAVIYGRSCRDSRGISESPHVVTRVSRC